MKIIVVFQNLPEHNSKEECRSRKTVNNCSSQHSRRV